MIQSNLKAIVAFILAAVLVFLTMKGCYGDRKDGVLEVRTPEKTVVVKLTTRVDTVFRNVPPTIIRDTIQVPTLVRVVDTVFVDGTKVVAMMPQIRREYKDKVKLGDSTAISYTANTTGTLDKISVEYEDTRAERTIIRTNTIEKTITSTIKPRGLYVGIGSNLGLTELSPSLQYVNNKNIYGVKYNVAAPTQGIQNIGITYSRKLF